MKRGGPLKRSAPLQRKTPLARSREPRQRRLRRPAMDTGLRDAVIKRARGSCEHCGKAVSKSRFEAHHRKLRSRGGEDSMANLIAIAPECHEWIHGHPKEAGALGLMLHSWESPADSQMWVKDKGWRWVA